MNDIQPNLLVRTPAQYPGESPLGFVLRASEENGYETPWHIFQLAGIAQGEMMTTGLDIERLARVLGRSSSTLHGYGVLDLQGNSVPGLAGHALHPRYLRLATPHLCPDCVVEAGFIPAWTDLAIVDACPVHRRKLMASCPACNTPIKWFRPGLLICRCGYDFAQTDSQPIGEAHASLLSAIISKVMGRACNDNSSGLPMQYITKMTLVSLVRLVHVLARFSLGANAREPIATAARVLSDWPRNFHEWLATLGAQRASISNSAGLRKQFQHFYCSLFKGGVVIPR